MNKSSAIYEFSDLIYNVLDEISADLVRYRSASKIVIRTRAQVGNPTRSQTVTLIKLEFETEHDISVKIWKQSYSGFGAVVRTDIKDVNLLDEQQTSNLISLISEYCTDKMVELGAPPKI